MKIVISSVKLILIIVSILFFSVGVANAGERVKTFTFPDIRESYCGPIMNYQYCKCGFHNELCKNIGMDKSTANVYVWDGYREWVREMINDMGERCEVSDDIWNSSRRSCTTCFDEHVRQGNICVKSDEEDTEESDEVKENDCSVDDDFDKNWEKYSDIDDRLGATERSYEAQQYATAIEEIVEMKSLVFEFQGMMEVDRIKRVEMRAIHDAIVHNQRVNLLKAFWRLTYITYATIDSSKGGGQTLVDFASADNVVTVISKGVKLIQANTPGDSALAIDTKKMKGKVRSIGANGALEALDSLGDPIKIVTQIAADSVKATYPSADISKEEVEILKSQFLRNRKLDVDIQESYDINKERRKTVMALKVQIAIFEGQAANWKAKEKVRVKNVLVDNCEDKKKK